MPHQRRCLGLRLRTIFGPKVAGLPDGRVVRAIVKRVAVPVIAVPLQGKISETNERACGDSENIREVGQQNAMHDLW